MKKRIQKEKNGPKKKKKKYRINQMNEQDTKIEEERNTNSWKKTKDRK